MFPNSNQAISIFKNSHQVPEALLLSIEKLYLGITEPLDPYIALALTNLSLQLVKTVYLMGVQDGDRQNQECSQCKDGKCIFSDF